MKPEGKAINHRGLASLLAAQLMCAVMVLICFSCSAAPPTTYYVDFEGGNDKNKGDSPSAPFKYCPGDKNAAANAGGTSLKPGDAVIFKGGTVYKGGIALRWSGKAGSEIVYDGNSKNNFGQGKAIMDGDNMSYPAAFDLPRKTGFAPIQTAVNLLKKKGISVPAVLSSQKKIGFIAIKNFEIRGYDKYGVYLNSADNVSVKDCNIHRISDWNLGKCNGTACNMDYVHNLGIGIFITGASQDVVVDRCNIERVGHCGVKVQGASKDIEVKNCDFHDYIHWMMDVAPLAGTDVLSNVLIHDNKFRDLYHYASSWWISSKGAGAHPEDEKIHPGADENPHLDGIFVRNPLEGTIENVRIYNNEFYMEKKFEDSGGTAMIFASQIGQSDSLYIYNNTFQYCYMHQAVTIYNTGGEVHFYGNTFYMLDKGAMRISGTGSTFVKNNIFYLENGLAMNVDDKASVKVLKSDYNIFKQGGRHLMYDGTFIDSFSQWQIMNGQDKNSQIVTDVKFENPQDVQNSGKSSLRPQAGSPAIGKGDNLSNIFSVDKAGAKRPEGKPWDIGAYQYEDKR